MAIYDRYAEVYDLAGQVRFSLRMIPYLNQLLERHGFHAESALDLACGTGTLAIALAAKGWKVYGVDASAAMLEQARAKMRESGVSVEFLEQDMRSFALPTQVDLITCMYDSLNYLLCLDDLQKTFQAVANALKNEGLLVFDMNTPYNLQRFRQSQDFFNDSEEIALINRCRFDDNAQHLTVTITGFIKRGELYERLVENHVQRAYEEKEIEEVLDSLGLKVAGKYACFTLDEPKEDSLKVVWVVRRGKA
jgi:ubiquinone/menaquinone biosynthesis C-methylase UbiE